MGKWSEWESDAQSEAALKPGALQVYTRTRTASGWDVQDGEG